jgi:hypothetical protein
MSELLSIHQEVLDQVKELVSNNFNLNIDLVELTEEELVNGAVSRFQIIFYYPHTNPMKPIYLNFEIYQNSPKVLCFESLVGLKKYDQTNHYDNLDSDILAFITEQIGDGK